MSTGILIKFKEQLIVFLDELTEQFPEEEGDLVMLKLFISNQMPIQNVMEKFIKQLDHNNKLVRKMIADRNEEFFLDHNNLPFVSSSKITKFISIWKSKKMNDENKQIIWAWIEAFVNIANKY
jgi:hypothetical protein